MKLRVLTKEEIQKRIDMLYWAYQSGHLSKEDFISGAEKYDREQAIINKYGE